AGAGRDGGPGSPDALRNPRTARERIAREAFVEGAVKRVRFLRASVPAPRGIVLSGRLAGVEGVRRGIAQRLEGIAPVRVLDGFAAEAKEGAQGAALIADGLCGGAHRPSAIDRKSTRLNSSHDQISYAVFCLKKKR